MTRFRTASLNYTKIVDKGNRKNKRHICTLLQVLTAIVCVLHRSIAFLSAQDERSIKFHRFLIIFVA